MMPMPWIRSAVGATQLVALTIGLVLVCPCPGIAPTNDAHGCCTSEGFRAATPCCQAAAAAQTTSPAQVVAPFVPASIDAPAAVLVSAVAAPAPMRGLRPSCPPPPVLRI
jgi:hypothetical protein